MEYAFLLTGLLAFAVVVIEEALEVRSSLERTSQLFRTDSGNHRGHHR